MDVEESEQEGQEDRWWEEGDEGRNIKSDN